MCNYGAETPQNYCATVGFAIESANTVGYLQNELSATTVSGTIDVGVSFSNIGTQGGAYTVSNMLFNTQVADGDVILIFNPAAYNYDWYQYMSDTGSGTPGWMVQDMETFDISFLTSEDDIILKVGTGAIFMPALGGTRTWTVSLSE